MSGVMNGMQLVVKRGSPSPSTCILIKLSLKPKQAWFYHVLAQSRSLRAQGYLDSSAMRMLARHVSMLEKTTEENLNVGNIHVYNESCSALLSSFPAYGFSCAG